MQEQISARERVNGQACAPIGLRGQAAIKGHWHLRAFDPQGHLIREDEWDNLVTDEGLNELLSAALAGGTPATTWYVGLTDGTPTAAADDTAASHAGWTEVAAYTETVRQTWAPGAVSGKSVSNSASKASFTINADGTTIGGAFLASLSTKSGTTGKLYAIGAFAGGDLTLSNGSSLEITATFTSAAA